MAVIAQTFDEEGAGGGARGRSKQERAAEVARLRVLLGGSAGGVGVGLLGDGGWDGGGAEGGGGTGTGTGDRVGDRPGNGSRSEAGRHAATFLGAEVAGAPDVPALAALRGVLPGGVLRRGGVVAVQDRARSWGEAPSYLALALAAGASAGGAWCGVVGMPAFGIAAAAGMGADLGRFLMVDEPGERWAEAVGVLAGAVDLVLVRPPRLPNGEHVRRIGARIRRTARQRGAALVVAGEWPGADLRLRLTGAVWSGLGAGTGHLTGRRVTIAVGGRGAAGRERTAQLWLPAADGAVREWVGEAAEHGDAGAAAATATVPTTAVPTAAAAEHQRFGVSAEIRDAGQVVRLRSA